MKWYNSVVFLVVLAGCNTPTPQMSLSASVSKTNPCTGLRQANARISISFAANNQSRMAAYDIFPQPNTPETNEFAWLCGRIDFGNARAQIDALLSPEAYQDLLAALDQHNFSQLPAKIGQAETVRDLHSFNFIIIAKQHRVQLTPTEANQSLAERQQFTQVWQVLNAVLPPQLAIDIEGDSL